jgi:predicted type IV restriction endonuclease
LDIAAAIQEALQHRDAPPPNESNTCEWVILPILYAIGYGKIEVVSRDADIAGKFPDYTLLPAAPQHSFFLEAKAWKVGLEDQHANQALNYANQNGKRWVVLTNGRQWRLYDNDIRGCASDKMVAEMNLEQSEQAAQFLEAIGKASVCAGRLPRFAEEETARRKRAQEEEQRRQQLEARTHRLSAVLQEELADQSSPLLAAMLANLQTREGLGDLAADDLVAHFRGVPPQTQTPAGPPVKIDPARSGPAVFQHKALLINVNRSAAETSLYEATRYAWKVKRSTAEQSEIVLATRQGIIVGAFIAHRWLEATAENFPGRNPMPGRFGFEGEDAPENIKKLYVGKRVPDEYRKRGAANPIKYTW